MARLSYVLFAVLVPSACATSPQPPFATAPPLPRSQWVASLPPRGSEASQSSQGPQQVQQRQERQQQQPAQQTSGSSVPAPNLPAVLTGAGWLRCSISATENGRQTLEITDGGGLEFDAIVSPIVDGTMNASGPEKGGSYRFTSHLAKPTKGRLPGVGEVDLDELDTKVAVEMTRYRQPAGKGTALHFVSADMSRRGIYVEFVGKAHSVATGEHFAFRVNLGAPSEGSGEVKPDSDNERAHVAAKVVHIRAPINTVVITTTIERKP